MRKGILLSIVLLIQLSASLGPQGGDILPDGAEILRPLYQDEKQAYFEVRVNPPGEPKDYEPGIYENSIQKFIYRLNKETNQYSRFVPYKLFCNVPQLRTKEIDAKARQQALFQGVEGIFFVDLNYEKGEWEPLMYLPRDFNYNTRLGSYLCNIKKASNPNLFIYSRPLEGRKPPMVFELGLIDVKRKEVKVLVPEVVRQNLIISSMPPNMPFVVYQDEYIFYPVTMDPWQGDRLMSGYDSLRLRSISSGDEIELATHELKLSCHLVEKEGELYFYDLNLGKVEDLVKRTQTQREGEKEK